MTMFPSIPGWDGIHPAMVQFPIVLLFVAPLFMLISLFARQAWRAWAGSALILMVLGAIGVWLAVASGHAAGQLVDKTPALERAIADHEAFGVQMRTVFTVLTLVFAAFMLLPVMIKKPLSDVARMGLYALFLVVYLGFTLVIGNTASRGGRLVHELAVHAMVGQQTAAVVAEQAAPAVASPRAAPEPPHQPSSQPAAPKAP